MTHHILSCMICSKLMLLSCYIIVGAVAVAVAEKEMEEYIWRGKIAGYANP